MGFYLRKPDPTTIPAILSRATPVLTMLGSWTTPSSTTVSNSPDESGKKQTNKHEYVQLKDKESGNVAIKCIQPICAPQNSTLPFYLIGSPITCGTRTTAVKHRKRKPSGCIPTVLRAKQGRDKHTGETLMTMKPKSLSG